MYKDDFSSDEEEKHNNTGRNDAASATGSARSRPYGWLEATDLVFENSIRDNFQMQEATDTMRKVFDIGMKSAIAL